MDTAGINHILAHQIGIAEGFHFIFTGKDWQEWPTVSDL
jgi:hypothetical protein